MELHVFLKKVEVIEYSSSKENDFSQRQRLCHCKRTRAPQLFTVCTSMSSRIGQSNINEKEKKKSEQGPGGERQRAIDQHTTPEPCIWEALFKGILNSIYKNTGKLTAAETA